jgi:NADH-quinone oxidoreductase subunit J
MIAPALLLPEVIFYVFATILVISSLMVISAKNSVHSVLFLILSFFTAAALFILLGAEFIAMLLVIVYVGAVAVLFLFVVMMLNINFTEIQKNFVKYLPLGIIIAIIVLSEFIMVIKGTHISDTISQYAEAEMPFNVTNTEALGLLIYTHYALIFEIAGFILLVAMVGAIVLTLRTRTGVRKQNINEQLNRNPQNSVKVVKVDIGKGI